MASWFSWQFGNRALSVFILHVGAKSTVDCCVLLECTRGVTEIAFFCCMCKNGLNFTNDWVCRCSGRLQNHCEKISRGTRVKKAPSLHRYTLVHPNITHIVSESWNKRENLSPFQIFYFFFCHAFLGIHNNANIWGLLTHHYFESAYGYLFTVFNQQLGVILC